MLSFVLMQEGPWSTALDRLGALGHGAEQGFFDFVVAIFLLCVGWAVAALLSRLVRGLLRGVHFGELVRRVAGQRTMRHEPAAVAGWAVYWIVMAISALLALQAMGYDLGSSVGERLADVLPRIVTSALLFAFGSLLALIAGAITHRFLETAGMRAARIVGQVVGTVLAGFSALLALEQLGFAAQFVMAVGIVAVGATGLALALAFGLGCRDLARDFIVEYLRSLDDEGPRRPE